MVKAICQVYGNNVNHGHVEFTQELNSTRITYYLTNLNPGLHGIHIHEKADLTKGCESLGPHFSLPGHSHSDINDPNGHLGDLGNLDVKSNRKAEYSVLVNNLPISGPYNIIGRSLVIHEKEDDLGKGVGSESKISGNSGKRIACGIIGFA